MDRTFADSFQVSNPLGPNPKDSGFQLSNKSKFDNGLLGQTLALMLNLSLDPDLSRLPLSSTSVVSKTESCWQSCAHGLSIFDVKTFIFPRSVINAVMNTYLVGKDNAGTVSGLLILANRGLVGLSTGGASLPEIKSALDTINSGFESTTRPLP